MRQFGPEIATLLLWAIALFATTRALTAAGASLSLVVPVFAVCTVGSIVILRTAGSKRSQSP